MDIPLPSDNTSKEGDKQGSKILSEKLEKNKFNKNRPQSGESRSRNSSKRESGSSHQNWNRYGSNHDRNKNNSDRKSSSNYETGKLRNSTYSNRGSGYAANKEFQGGSRNFKTNLNHEYGSEEYNASSSSSYEPINIQQNSSNFNPSLNTLNSIPTPSFGYGSMNLVNQCYDPSGMSNLTTANNITQNFNYGSQNLNAYNNSSNYSQLNPIVPPVINSYSYPEVNSINLPNNMSAMQPPLNMNYNVGVQGMRSSDCTSNYSSYSSEGPVVSTTNLVLPLPPLPPILPKAYDVKIKDPVSEVPLPKQPPKLSIMPDTVPPPLSSDLTESSLDYKSSFNEVACASQNNKLSHMDDAVKEESKAVISDISMCNSSLRETVALNKEPENSSNKSCGNQELQLNLADTSCEAEGNKIANSAFENNEKEMDNVDLNIKKVKLSFPSNVKIGNVEKSFLDLNNSPSPKKICNFPLLGKEEAKKRLRAFSASKLLVKEKTAKPSRVNPLQDDHDDNESNGQTDHGNEEKKEISHKKKKIPEKTQIAEIKEREEKLKEILVNNTELFKNFDKDMTLANFPGLDFFDFSNLDKFEKKNNAVAKFFEGKREEEEKREGIEKGYSCTTGRDRNRKRDKKYSRSDSREGRHEESNKVKKCKSSQRKEVELPKSWSDVKDRKLKIEDLCNMLQHNKHSRSRSRSHSPSLETESKNYKGRDKRKFPNDPFPYLPKNFRDLQALKRDEISPLSKDYNSFRQENLKKSYRGCNVQYTYTKPIVCYNIDSERYDYHYLSQKALKYKNSSDIMDIMFSFHNKSFDIRKLGRNMGSAKSRMWYPEDWREAVREKNIEKERQDCVSVRKQKDDHSSKESPCNLNVDDEQNMLTSESLSVIKQRNKKDKYKRNAMERKRLDNCDKKTDSDIDMHARFFTEENDEDEEEMVYEDDSSEGLIETKKLLKEPNQDSLEKSASVTECADEKLYDELTSKSFLLNEEYKAYLCSVDNKKVQKSKYIPTQLIETSFEGKLNLKSRSTEFVKENKSKISDESARKAYIEVKAKLRDSKLNEKEFQKLLKLKKELKLQKRLEKKLKKKPKKEKKEIKKKKDKKAKKALQEEIKIPQKKEESLDDVSPEQDMSEYEVIESENYDEESEDRNIGSESEKPEKRINLELSSHEHHSPSSILESSNVKLIQKEGEVPASDHEEDRYSPSNISQYSEEGIDVDTSNMAMDLSSPIVASPSPQFDATDSPSSLPYSPSNIFDDDEHAPSPYSPSSPQSSGSLSPPPFDEPYKNKQGTILNSIPIPPKLNKLADNLSQFEKSNDKNHSSGELKEPSISETAVKGFQPVIFKLNLTKQTNAKLLQKPSLAGFDFDEEEEMENTKSPLPIPEMKDLLVPSSNTHKDKLLLPINESKIEKHFDEIRKDNEKDDLKSDCDNPRKRDPEKKMKRKSPSPRKSSRRHSRSRSRSPKEYKRKSYEKSISKSPSRKEKCYRDGSPIALYSYRKKERSRTPENYKRLSNRSPSASEKQRHVKSPNLEKVCDVYEKDLYLKKNSRSRTPSPVSKWKKVRSPPPKKLRHKSSYDHTEEPLSQYSYERDMPMEDYSKTSSFNHSRSVEGSPEYEAGTKHKVDDNFYSSYNEEYSMPISSISNQYPRNGPSYWERENNENPYSSTKQNKLSLSSSNSPLSASFNERSKEDNGSEFDEEYHHAPEFDPSHCWEFNSNQVPQQIAGSSQVIRVGNVLQVLPQDSSLENDSSTSVVPHKIIPATLQETMQSTPIMPRKIVQAGNIIEVVPEGISEQEILNTNADDQVGAVFKNGLVPPIPLPDKSLPQKSVVDKLAATKVLPEKLSSEINIFEHSISFKSLPENLPPLSNLQDSELPHLETVPENLTPLKSSPDNLSSIAHPMLPVSTSAPMPVSNPNPMDIISSLFTSSLLRTEHNMEGSASHAQIVSNQSTSSAMLNSTFFNSETFTSQENAMISNLDPLNSSSVELRTANVEPPLATSLESQQQAIFSAAVSAARGDTTGESALAQLISVIQQRHMAPATVDKISLQLPMDQPMMNVDLEAFKQQKRERKERKQKEKEQRLARRERRRIERENLERRSKSNLSDDEDDILMKEAITEVPDLGSPVPEYEIYNDDDDEDEQEQENKAKPALVLLPPPEKGILILPNNNRNQNIAKIKSVSFADGVIPGDGTDVSGGEEIHSPPPPNTEPEKKKGKKLTKKKRVKVKPIKQFIFGNNRMDSPPPPPIIPPNGNVIKLYQGCSYASCTAPSTYVVYTQRSVEANGNVSLLGKV